MSKLKYNPTPFVSFLARGNQSYVIIPNRIKRLSPTPSSGVNTLDRSPSEQPLINTSLDRKKVEERRADSGSIFGEILDFACTYVCVCVSRLEAATLAAADKCLPRFWQRGVPLSKLQITHRR